MPQYSLSESKKYLLLGLSFLLVAFGQPVWAWWTGLLSAAAGFALFWRVLLPISSKKERFCIAMGWYAGVQMVQLGWFASHPYAYIYGVMFFCAWLMGSQLGLIALWIQPSSLKKLPVLFALASLWTLLEWTRLFILSGLSFNPVGLSLSGSIYALQLASVGGVFFLSFWVMITNLFVLRAWLYGGSLKPVMAALFLILFPYAAGFFHYHYHAGQMLVKNETLDVIVVQSALPIEEYTGFATAEELRAGVLKKWQRILGTTQKHIGKRADLIVLPEYVVPYGTYPAIFPISSVQKLFLEVFGAAGSKALPDIKRPYADLVETDKGKRWLVSNAYIVQSLANLFQAHVIAGLEDSVYVDEENSRFESYSSAFHFSPGSERGERYEKRVLVPMGEYIPFEFCRKMAARYGISGSFTCGKEAKVFSGPIPCGPTICYEETYGDLVRENRQKGAELLVNLTNDGWYPHSRLPQQHFDHARLRTVENGVPLVRSCNTGITGGLNSLGEVIAVLGPDHLQTQENPDSLRITVPKYHYQTLYSRLGDALILSLCAGMLLLPFIIRK
ncbi:MAG: apolipoprotein N-acyltransferase [Candidatus Protochlamydia sp.]|nr:apolipoprotein N-acyltransferase [Candidatus Protochlamydia sp.]